MKRNLLEDISIISSLKGFFENCKYMIWIFKKVIKDLFFHFPCSEETLILIKMTWTIFKFDFQPSIDPLDRIWTPSAAAAAAGAGRQPQTANPIIWLLLQPLLHHQRRAQLQRPNHSWRKLISHRRRIHRLLLLRHRTLHKTLEMWLKYPHCDN